MSTEDFISHRIEQLCKSHSVSKYWLAQKTGLTQTALARIINRKCIPTVSTIEKICIAFDISLSQFFICDDNMVELNNVQREILDTWNDLNGEEKRIFLNFVRSIKGD